MLIDAERDNKALEERIGDEDDVAMAAITAAELLVGVELADRRRRDRRQLYVTAIFETISIRCRSMPRARPTSRSAERGR